MTNTNSVPSSIVEIPLKAVLWHDVTTQLRCGIDADQIDNLKAAYEAGQSIPPLDLFIERSSGEGFPHYFIGDGWHRFHVACELKRETVSAVVHEGGKREALRFALGANATHGLRRSNKDKRKAVEVAIKEFPELSNRGIAELCRVSPGMVDYVRPQVPKMGTSRMGQDGKRYPVKAQNGTQLDFFELVGREWKPVVKSFDLTIKSVAWLDEKVAPEQKLEAISAMRRQLDDMKAQLVERERSIKASLGQPQPEPVADSRFDPSAFLGPDRATEGGRA